MHLSLEVSPDGQRFLIVKYPEEATPERRLVYVPNWFEELKEAMAAGQG